MEVELTEGEMIKISQRGIATRQTMSFGLATKVSKVKKMKVLFLPRKSINILSDMLQ